MWCWCGFIGGHLVKDLMNEGHTLVCADIKPVEYWFQIFDENTNFSFDLKEYENCLTATKRVLNIFITWHAIWVEWDL